MAIDDKLGLIIDFETMGKKVDDCAVIDCSYFVFSFDKMVSDNPYTTRNLVDMKKSKLSIKDQVDNYKWKVYKDAIDFWATQPLEIQKKIAPKQTDITVSEFTKDFISYISSFGKISNWWSRSNSFDPPILWRLFESQKMSNHLHEYLPHYRVRDTRTYIDAKLDFPIENSFIPVSDTDFWKKVFQIHDSSWDILADLLRMQALLRAERDLEMIKR